VRQPPTHLTNAADLIIDVGYEFWHYSSSVKVRANKAIDINAKTIMANLDFILMGHQDWDVQSVHTGAIVGAVRFNPGWNMFSFESAGLRLDSASMREIAKFLDEQDGLRRQQ